MPTVLEALIEELAPELFKDGALPNFIHNCKQTLNEIIITAKRWYDNLPPVVQHLIKGENNILEEMLYLSMLRYFYEHDERFPNNPMLAWMAIARHQKIAIDFDPPQWALNAVLQHAPNIQVVNQSSGDKNKAFSQAMGFPNAKWMTRCRDYELRLNAFFELESLIKDRQCSANQAYEILLQKGHIHKSKEWLITLHQEYKHILNKDSLPSPWGS